MPSLPGLPLNTAVGAAQVLSATVGTNLDLIGQVNGATKFAAALADLLVQEVRSQFDTTVMQRAQHLQAELVDCSDMTGGLMDIFLPDHLGIFSSLNGAVIALSQIVLREQQALFAGGTLPPQTPYTLDNATLTAFDAVSYFKNLVDQQSIDIPFSNYLSGGLAAVGDSHVVGNRVEFGATPAEAAAAAPDIPAQQVLDAADFKLALQTGAHLSFSGSAAFDLGAKVVGIGTITATAIELHGATIAPGNSPGTITLDGPVAMDSGDIQMEVGGSDAGSYDQLRFTGSVALQDGTIEILPLNGFRPAPGTSVPLFAADTGPLDFSRMHIVMGDFGGVTGRLETDGSLRFETPGTEQPNTGQPDLEPPSQPPDSSIPVPAASWDALAADVLANFQATGHWFVSPGLTVPLPPANPVDWDALAAQVITHFEATGNWYL